MNLEIRASGSHYRLFNVSPLALLVDRDNQLLSIHIQSYTASTHLLVLRVLAAYHVQVSLPAYGLASIAEQLDR